MTVLLPFISVASEHEEVTLPFQVFAEVEEDPEFNEEGIDTTIVYGPVANAEVWTVRSGRRVESRVDDIPMQALADLTAKMDEVFSLMGSSQQSGYDLETIELHVTANAEGGFFIASTGIEGGMKLIFTKK